MPVRSCAVTVSGHRCAGPTASTPPPRDVDASPRRGVDATPPRGVDATAPRRRRDPSPRRRRHRPATSTRRSPRRRRVPSPPREIWVPLGSGCGFRDELRVVVVDLQEEAAEARDVPARVRRCLVRHIYPWRPAIHESPRSGAGALVPAALLHSPGLCRNQRGCAPRGADATFPRRRRDHLATSTS